MKKYLKQIKAIKTENDFKDAHITICQACSNYELTWAEFEKLLVASGRKGVQVGCEHLNDKIRQ